MQQESSTQDQPRLIEPQARNYMSDILYKCTQTRAKIYSNVLNISVGILFVCITSLVLYFCYKNRPTAQELYNKEIKDQAYILSKIRQYKEERRNIESKSMITGLPIT